MGGVRKGWLQCVCVCVWALLTTQLKKLNKIKTPFTWCPDVIPVFFPYRPNYLLFFFSEHLTMLVLSWCLFYAYIYLKKMQTSKIMFVYRYLSYTLGLLFHCVLKLLPELWFASDWIRSQGFLTSPKPCVMQKLKDFSNLWLNDNTCVHV